MDKLTEDDFNQIIQLNNDISILKADNAQLRKDKRMLECRNASLSKDMSALRSITQKIHWLLEDEGRCPYVEGDDCE